MTTIVIICVVLLIIFGLSTDERKKEYDADFLPSSAMLSRYNKGFSINNRSLSLSESFKNLMVLGQTGSGKSTCITIPSCLRMIGHASFCINDPSGEIASNVSGALKQAGYEVIIINYTKPEFAGYNVLNKIKSRSDIHKISEQIVFSSLGRGKDPFWNISASGCLNIFIELACSLPAEFRNMYSVVALLNCYSYDPQTIDRLIVKSNIPTLVEEYKVFNSYDSKVIQNILATVKASTKIFTDPQVALTTSYDSVNFEGCRKKPTAIFFNNSVTSMKYYGVITALFFEQFFADILSRIPNKKELPVFFIIDEASSLYMNSLQISVSNVRKVRAGILLVFQSYHQAVSLYGHDEAKSLRENCASVAYLPGQPIDLAKEISATLGSFQFLDETNKTHIRQLLTPDEAHQLDECLLLSGNRRAIKLPMRPFYESYSLKRLSQIPPYIPPNNLPYAELPMIDFNKL